VYTWEVNHGRIHCWLEPSHHAEWHHHHGQEIQVQGLAYKEKTVMEFNSDIMNRGGQAPVQVIKASYKLTEG